MSSSKLRATASEFCPTFSLPGTRVDNGFKHVFTVTSQQNEPVQADCHQQQQQQHPAADTDLSASHGEPSLAEADYHDEYEDYDEYGGYYDEEGIWVACDPEEHWREQQSSAEEVGGGSQKQGQLRMTQQHQHDEQAFMGADDAVALLHSCYPTHPRALLQQLVEACECDVQQAARILSDMDYEQRRARIAAAAAAGRPGAAAAAAFGSSGGGSSSSTSASRKQQFNYSLEQFPALGEAPDVSTAAAAAGKPTNWAAVTKKPPSTSPPPPTSSKPQHSTANPNSSSSSSISSRQLLPGAQVSSKPHGTTNSSSRGSNSAANNEAAVPWVETGAAVSKEYAAARAEASDHARVRNACFHQATLAYLSGDKALAKELSAKGKAAAEAMWAAHDTASSQIYQQRNARLQQQVASTRGGGAAVIDLHGLHVQEMMKTLPQQLAALAAKQHDSASVIVGVGRHTKGPPSARMGPAVEALLKDLGYSYKQPQPGLIRVRLH